VSSIYVYDRSGIWKLRDTNNDGEADVYEMFCNRFAQTAETREFPNSMKLAPDGSFLISKGGQEGTTRGKDNGTVIRVAPDGKSYEVIGYGLRQPVLGVHPKTGLVTASDQEGNYTPTTPLQIIKDHHYYGFLSELEPKEQYPETIADPLTWIPHPVVASAATQTWLTDAKMGAVNDEMVLISYNKPELFRVLTSDGASPLSGKPQAAVVPWIKDLDFPTLNAAVNLADGQLYVTGFQIWGTTVKRISGLARVRYTGQPRVLLKQITPMDKGVLLCFNEPLDKAAASEIANYSIERWNYQRTYKYGSPHLKLDGQPGQEWMQPSSAYLAKDGKSVFIGIPDMKAGVMQMRVGWGIKGADGGPAQNNAYFTPYELAKFEPGKAGFENVTVDLTPRKVVAAAVAKPTKEEGEKIYQMMGCIACHSTDGALYGKVGPTWKGLFGSERLLAKGGDKCIADEAYIKESIQNPSAKIVKGYEKFDTGMPIYAGVLTDSQIESIILFIKSLK
jgi:cytochrome c2